jgi:limonene-1,2-epoxide hydrolase
MPDGSEIRATGKAVELPVAGVITVGDDKIVGDRDFADIAARVINWA